MLESLFNKIVGLEASNFVKRDSNTGVFLWKLRKFLKTSFFTEHLRWLLLCLVDSYCCYMFWIQKFHFDIWLEKWGLCICFTISLLIRRRHWFHLFDKGYHTYCQNRNLFKFCKAGASANLKRGKISHRILRVKDLYHTEQSYLNIIGIELILK